MSDTLLIADHDQALCETLARELEADGYATATATAVRAVAVQLANHHRDLLLLGDLDRPGAQGRLLGSLRAGGEPFAGAAPQTPTIVLAAGGGQLALLRCFEAGADDFLVKPASYLELRARIRALLARSAGQRTPPTVRVGALEIDAHAGRARCAGRELCLSRLELALLCQLGSQPTRLHTKDELLRSVWGFAQAVPTRTVDAHACRLRRKLERAGAAGLVVNHRGVGYALTTPAGNGTAA